MNMNLQTVISTSNNSINNHIKNNKQESFEEKEIDYNIFNALNLCNPALGLAYQTRGFNPFNNHFNFCPEYVERMLKIAKNKNVVVAEKFLERGNKEVADLFFMALNNTKSLIAGIQMMKPNKEDNARFQDFLIFLKNRAELLEQNIILLKNENQDSFKLYQDLVSIDLEYSNLIKDTFYDRFNRDLIIMNFLEYYNLGKKKKTLAQQIEEEILSKIFLFEPRKKKNKELNVANNYQDKKLSNDNTPTDNKAKDDLIKFSQKSSNDSNLLTKNSSKTMQPINSNNFNSSQIKKTSTSEKINNNEQELIF